jgi:hypothetical protein
MEDELRSLRGAARCIDIPQVPLEQLKGIAVSLRQTTLRPSASRADTKFDPMNPAPPVTR